MEQSLIISIVITLLLSAFFSGMEIAYISADKLHIELMGQKGGVANKLLVWLTKRPSMVISTLLVGNTFALTVYGILMASVLEPWLQLYVSSSLAMILQVVLSTLLVLFTAEFLPKSLFLINPNKMLSIFALPFTLIYWVLWLISSLVVLLSKVILVYVFKGSYSDEKPAFGLTDLNNFISQMTKSLEKEESAEVDTKMFNNALQFKKVKVRECMVPRTELIMVDIEDGLEELTSAFIDSGYSKIPIYKDSIDNIIGYCHSSKLFKKPDDIEQILSKITIVPETKLANDLMIEFIEKRKNIALVVDEFGGTSGIVTMEDVMEKIFGDIQDEHDDEELEEQQLSTNKYLFSARQEIDDLNDKYNLNIPEGEYDTLGGYILEKLEDFPKESQRLELDNFVIYIKAMDGLKIDKVQLIVNSDKEPTGSDH